MNHIPRDALTNDRPTSDTSTSGTPAHGTLTRLAQSMESLRPAGAQPAWAEIVGPFDHPEHVRWHPDLDTLMGFVAPKGCDAIAAVSYGWGRTMDDREARLVAAVARGVGADIASGAPPGQPLLAAGERRRVRIVCLMTRTGDMAGYLRSGPTVLIDEPPTVGRIPDCLRRCFRLPTPPPEQSTDCLFARIWLANICGGGPRPDGPLNWPEVIRLHPAVQVAAEAGITISGRELLLALRAAGEIWTWTYLTCQAASPGWLADFLPPGAAGWMDEGILSRWLLGSMSGVEVLMERVTALVAPTAAKRLRTTLRQLGVGATSHPEPGRASNN